MPWRQRWLHKDINRGDSVHKTNIINSTPTLSLRRFASGMIAGTASPARRWFRLSTSQAEISAMHEVREYLREVEDRMWEAFAKSNLYQQLAAGVFPDIGQIGNSAMFVEEHRSGAGIQCEAMAVGEYYLCTGADGTVNTFIRTRPMRVRQIAEKFGVENASPEVQRIYKAGEQDPTFVVHQAVVPNTGYMPHGFGPAGMKWASLWWEENAPEGAGFLHEGGYEEFPVMCPRWDVRPGDVYGRGLGWQVVGDCKELQHHQRVLMDLLDGTTTPPMRGAGVVGNPSLIPGDITYMSSAKGGFFEPSVVIPPQAISFCADMINRVENRIQETFYIDLWLAMSQDDRNQRATATEVEVRRQEAMLQLGPLLENLNNELFKPLIERTFAILSRQGRMPIPPDVVIDAQESDPSDNEGPLKIEFVSILHQAQRMTDITGIRELIGQAQVLAAIGKVDALDKINSDAVMDEVAEMLGVKPELVLADDEVKALREQQAEQLAAKQNGQAMLAATQGAKNLAGVEPQKLTDIAQMIAPVAAAQGGLNQ